MWIEVATLEHIICPRIRRCPNQTGKSPYVEEHHLRTGEIRPGDVTVALRRWARVAGRWLFSRDPLLIFRGIYMETVALVFTDCPQISRYFTIDPQGTLDWQTQRLAERLPQNMCEEPNMCEIWVLERTTRIRTDGAEDEPEITVRLMMELGNGFTADPNQDNNTFTRAQVFLK